MSAEDDRVDVALPNPRLARLNLEDENEYPTAGSESDSSAQDDTQFENEEEEAAALAKLVVDAIVPEPGATPGPPTPAAAHTEPTKSNVWFTPQLAAPLVLPRGNNFDRLVNFDDGVMLTVEAVCALRHESRIKVFDRHNELLVYSELRSPSPVDKLAGADTKRVHLFRKQRFGTTVALVEHKSVIASKRIVPQEHATQLAARFVMYDLDRFVVNKMDVFKGVIRPNTKPKRRLNALLQATSSIIGAAYPPAALGARAAAALVDKIVEIGDAINRDDKILRVPLEFEVPARDELGPEGMPALSQEFIEERESQNALFLRRGFYVLFNEVRNNGDNFRLAGTPMRLEHLDQTNGWQQFKGDYIIVQAHDGYNAALDTEPIAVENANVLFNELQDPESAWQSVNMADMGALLTRLLANARGRGAADSPLPDPATLPQDPPPAGAAPADLVARAAARLDALSKFLPP